MGFPFAQKVGGIYEENGWRTSVEFDRERVAKLRTKISECFQRGEFDRSMPVFAHRDIFGRHLCGCMYPYTRPRGTVQAVTVDLRCNEAWMTRENSGSPPVEGIGNYMLTNVSAISGWQKKVKKRQQSHNQDSNTTIVTMPKEKIIPKTEFHEASWGDFKFCVGLRDRLTQPIGTIRSACAWFDVRDESWPFTGMPLHRLAQVVRESESTCAAQNTALPNRGLSNQQWSYR